VRLVLAGHGRHRHLPAAAWPQDQVGHPRHLSSLQGGDAGGDRRHLTAGPRRRLTRANAIPVFLASTVILSLRRIRSFGRTTRSWIDPSSPALREASPRAEPKGSSLRMTRNT